MELQHAGNSNTHSSAKSIPDLFSFLRSEINFTTLPSETSAQNFLSRANPGSENENGA